ncbi:MAG: Outer membrane protein assembly factor BamB [Phycisphaerae bacterium]|nr:Outer membrane protein assembly factor BamB [Phycisphaerae bacterium]
MALAACATRSGAQPYFTQSATAALPESNEAMLLSSQAREAAERGDYRLSIQLIQRIAQLDAALVADPGSKAFYPAWRQGRRLLAGLPADGLAYYRQLYDGEAEARLKDALDASDTAALGELLRAYPVCTRSPEIVRELVTRLLEAGQCAPAIETIADAQSLRSEPLGSERRAQLVVALTGLGAWSSADEELARLESDGRAAGGREAQRAAALRAWFEGRRHASAGDAGAMRINPLLSMQGVWERPLRGEAESEYFEDDRSLCGLIEKHRRLPLVQPLLTGETLVVRARGRLHAIDALTLFPRWATSELVPADSVEARGVSQFGRGEGGESEAGGFDGSNDARNLLWHFLRHAVSTAFDQLYTIENLTLLRHDDASTQFPGRFIFEPADAVYSNVLVARDLNSGRLLWKLGDDPADRLFGVAFQDVPVPVGEHIAVAAQRRADLLVCVIDPRDGRLVREIPIVGPPTFFTVGGGRCLLAQDETSIYVCTGNGVIACLSKTYWDWKWAATYPSTLGAYLARRNQVMPIESMTYADPQPARPIVYGGMLLAAPIDGRELLALDCFTGVLRWSAPLTDYAQPVGATPFGVVLSGYNVSCVDLRDGKTVRWRTIPMEITGRPLVRDDRVYVPVRTGLLVVDARTGKLMAERDEGPHASQVGNVISSGDSLYCVSPNRVTKYPDVERLSEKCESMLAAAPEDARAQLALAWLEIVSGRFEAALARIEASSGARDAYAQERDALLSHLFVTLSSGSDGPQRLAWLRRAQGLSRSPAATGRLSVLLGQALEDAGRWEEAAAHYRQMLFDPSSGQIEEHGLSRRLGLHARQRLRALLARLDEPGQRTWEAELICEAGGVGALDALLPHALELCDDERLRGDADAALARLHEALQVVRVPEHRLAARQALTLLAARPELTVDYLTGAEDDALPEAVRRRLLLARWETHVALGMTEETQADREAWATQFGGGPASSAPATREGESEADRIALLDAALTKLHNDERAAPPFAAGFTRSWRLSPEAECRLVVDARRGTGVVGRCVLIRNSTEHELQLRRLNSGAILRKTHDSAGREGTVRAAEEETAELFWATQRNRNGATPATWPALIDGWLAVTPVRGGLVCVGLGPERRAGSRLWEHEFAEAFDVEGDFAARAVLTPMGVFFAPRVDRLLALDRTDGRLRWRRDLAGIEIARIMGVGDQLVVVGRDHRLLFVSAEAGDVVRSLPDTLATPSGAWVVDGTLVVALGRVLMALDEQTLEPRWRIELDGSVEEVLPAGGSSVLAVRTASTTAWTLQDVRDGRARGAFELRGLGQPTALWLEGQRLLVGSVMVDGEGEERRQTVHLAAFDTASGQRAWLRSAPSAAAINESQLAAHPSLIPLLLAGGVIGGEDVDARRRLAIQCVARDTGELLAPESIGEAFQRSPDVSAAVLLASPTRVVVSVDGKIAAFGRSRYRTEP